MVNLGGFVPLSTVDWPGYAAFVVFLRGCPLRCPHCHNYELQNGESFADLSLIKDKLQETLSWEGLSPQITLEEAFVRAGAEAFVSALVFSGGEPLMQPEGVESLARYAKGLGLCVGLETCGFYPQNLSALLDCGLLDRVFLDLKAPFREEDYRKATGRAGVALRAKESLGHLLFSGVPLEVRVTVFPEILDEVLSIARGLFEMLETHPGHRLDRLTLQAGMPRSGEFSPVARAILEATAGSIRDEAPIEIEIKVVGPPKVHQLSGRVQD